MYFYTSSGQTSKTKRGMGVFWLLTLGPFGKQKLLVFCPVISYSLQREEGGSRSFKVAGYSELPPPPTHTHRDAGASGWDLGRGFSNCVAENLRVP